MALERECRQQTRRRQGLRLTRVGARVKLPAVSVARAESAPCWRQTATPLAPAAVCPRASWAAFARHAPKADYNLRAALVAEAGGGYMAHACEED